MGDLNTVWFPGRVVNRHVGGNTTYARELIRGLNAHQIATRLLPMGPHPLVTGVLESLAAVPQRQNSVIHYSADTGALIPTRTPNVVTVHGVASRWITVARSSSAERIWRFRVGRAIRNASRVITVSHASQRDVADVFDMDPESIEVIYHGLDTQQVASSLPAGFDSTRPFVLFFGNLEPRKNLVNLIQAFQRPKLRALGVRLVIAGRPAWSFDEILAAIAASDNVDYLGFVSESERLGLLEHAELFAFPSHYEGFGLPVLEAMRAGIRVACTSNGALEELAGPSIEVASTEPDDIANAIHLGLTEPEDEVRTRVASGIAWAESFTWDKSVNRHLDVYKEAVR